MVSFPANPLFSNRLHPEAEPVQLGTVLPDVLSRYGISLSPVTDSPDRLTAGRSLPSERWTPIAVFHSEGIGPSAVLS